MWLRSVLLICGVIALTLADNPSGVVRISGDNLARAKNIAVTTYQPPRAISIEEFVSSRKLPENVARSSLDEDDEYIDERKVAIKDNRPAKKVIQKFENTEKKVAALEPARRFDSAEEDESLAGKRQARVELENFSDTGKLLQEERIKKVERPRPREQDEIIPGVYVSAEYPTTMLPVLTTPREARGKDSPFDFVPVNIIREDSKDGFSRFSNANFGDLGDVSLVPAGTNSRIQVKKGPNGKDYEYEYVYYYYDEEDENKAGTAGSAVTNSYDIPSRTTAAPRRGGTAGSNRSKYNTVERSSTVEPSNNEVIPNRNGNRGRQLTETEDIAEERLPANTRFPPRSRSNHNTGTTEPSRTRNNRPRPSLDLVDSSSFRTHQEGPEFPQTLPKGPVRFLGVTPNEDSEDKPSIRNRGRPQKVQEPAPVEEVVDDAPSPVTRKRPTTAAPETEVELSRGQPIHSREEEDDEENVAPERSNNKRISLEDKAQDSSETEASLSSSTTADTTDNPTTEYPVMDKVALDLYAFLQQGQSNLIDASNSEAGEIGDSTTLPDDEITTDLTTTTELADTTIVNESAGTTPTTTTTTTTEPTTTTTTTTEPSTTTTQVPAGRGKFRRPGIGGIGGPAVSRNRFKSNGGAVSTTEAPAPESTQRTRGRFGSGANGGSGFKRPRPGGSHKPIEEDTVQKESASSVNAEKPGPGRGRFRAPTGGRIAASTTTAAPSNGGPATSNGAAATATAAARPAFNKVNINRRRGRPTTAAPGGEEQPQETAANSEGGQTAAQNAQTATAPGAAPKSAVRARLPGAPAIRPAIRPGGSRVNLRQKPGQATTTTTLAPEGAEVSVEEPAGEGTEEETHEAPAETNPPARATTSNPLNKLRNRNRLQVHPKTTTKAPSLTPSIRRSPLLPRRKVTEAPAAQTSQEDVVSEEEATSGETEATEATSAETSTAASTKHEETRGLGGLLAPRRRIPARRPGQIVARE